MSAVPKHDIMLPGNWAAVRSREDVPRGLENLRFREGIMPADQGTYCALLASAYGPSESGGKFKVCPTEPSFAMLPISMGLLSALTCARVVLPPRDTRSVSWLREAGMIIWSKLYVAFAYSQGELDRSFQESAARIFIPEDQVRFRPFRKSYAELWWGKGYGGHCCCSRAYPAYPDGILKKHFYESGQKYFSMCNDSGIRHAIQKVGQKAKEYLPEILEEARFNHAKPPVS